MIEGGLPYYSGMLCNYINLHGEVAKILNPQASTVTSIPECNLEYCHYKQTNSNLGLSTNACFVLHL